MAEETVVVGGGVNGLTTAVLLAERGHQVRVWSREPAGRTVSAVAGGLCWPYRVEPVEQATAWAVASLRVFEELSADPEATGVRMVSGMMAGAPWLPDEWSGVTGSRRLGPEELPLGLPAAVRARTAVLSMPVYLRYLRDRLEAAGGRWERRNLASLDEAGRLADLVVNCTGLGARDLVPDPGVRSIQGQLVVVDNPGVEEWYVAAEPGSPDSTYMLPQPFGLVLGGTARDGVEVTVADADVARDIMARCARIDPRVAEARVLDHRVGLRPGRHQVRVEAEVLPGGSRCVHNYGHGGSGITVSWASAEAAVRLATTGAD